MTEEELRRFRKYVRRILLAGGIMTVLNREELKDLKALLEKHQQESEQASSQSNAV